jgi:WhiB family redox-sensing transcriptional regulator
MSKLDWQDEGLCRDMDTDVFFGAGDQMTDREVAIARVICDRCPVKSECRDYAVGTNQKAGVWGGTTPSGRMRLRSQWIRERGRQDALRRRIEAQRLAEMGCTADQIAAQLGVHVRTAQRISAPRVAVTA